MADLGRPKLTDEEKAFILWPAEPPVGVPAPAAGDPDRLVVQRMLMDKINTLEAAKRELYKRLAGATTGEDHYKITDAIMEAGLESDFCQARYGAIERGMPFPPLPNGMRQSLLTAIENVSRAVAQAGAISALIAAVHGLVVAFPAKDT